jgi:hypothetical protein
VDAPEPLVNAVKGQADGGTRPFDMIADAYAPHKS